VLAAVLAAFATCASAANLEPVAKDRGWCKHVDDGFCHEWKLTDDPRIRIVHSGFEDGADFYLYRRNALGQYRLQFTFEPMLRTAKPNGA
jgi:hypothetical protein